MNRESKTGRNNMCHCGSMKKFKNCCLRLYEEKRERFRQLGLRRFREFSWEKTADMTIDLYKKVMLYE